MMHWSTEHIPQNHRFEAWVEVVNASTPTSINAPSKDSEMNFHATFSVGAISRIGLARGCTESFSGRRTLRDLKRLEQDTCVVFFDHTKVFRTRIGNDAFVLKENQMLILESGKEYSFESAAGETTFAEIPTELLVDFSGGHKPKSRIVDASRGMGAVLLDAIRRLTDDFDAFAGEGVEDVESFLANTIARTFCGPSRSDLKGHKTRLLERAKNYIRTNISDPDLKTQSVADHLSLSVRAIHQLFELDSDSCAAYIRKLRLEHIYNVLKNNTDGIPISQVAYAFGFTNMSHFSKLFRQHYGVQPSKFSKIGNYPPSSV